MIREAPPSVVASRRARRRLWLRVAGSFIVLAALFLVVPAGDLLAAIRALPWIAWPLAISAYLASHLLGVGKWRLLTNTAGAGLSVRQAVYAYYWGLFGNLFLPSIVGGDVVRAGVALRHARSKSGLVLGSLVDRLLDVAGLGLLAGVGALLSPRALDLRSRRIFLVFAALLVLVALAAVAASRLVPVRRLPFRLRRKLVLVRRALRATAARPTALAMAFVAGLALQSALIVLNWSLGRSIGLDIPLYVWFFVWPLAKISGLLPVTQGGIGVREASQVALFAPFGVTAVMALAVGLVFEAVIISGGLLSGVIALLLRTNKPAALPGSQGPRRHAPIPT